MFDADIARHSGGEQKEETGPRESGGSLSEETGACLAADRRPWG